MEKARKGRTGAQDSYDAAHVETISFKARKGSRERIKVAASGTGQSVNGYIRAALNRAVQSDTGEPMEVKEAIQNAAGGDANEV